MQVYLDRIDGASFQTDGILRRHIRVGFVDGIDVTLAADPLVLVKAAQGAGMPQYGDPHPSGDGTSVQRIYVRGVSHNQARVEIEYGQPQTGGPAPGMFTISDDTTLVTRRTNWHPKDRQQIKVYLDMDWSAPAARDDGLDRAGNAQAPEIPYLAPLRTLTVSGIFFRPPSDALRQAMGKVNERLWYGLKPGYWLCARHVIMGESYSRDGNPFQYRMTSQFITKGFEDWSESVLWLNMDGRHEVPDSNDIRELREGDYSYGIINRPKVTKIGIYPTLDFAATFGFDTKNSHGGLFPA